MIAHHYFNKYGGLTFLLQSKYDAQYLKKNYEIVQTDVGLLQWNKRAG